MWTPRKHEAGEMLYFRPSDADGRVAAVFVLQEVHSELFGLLCVEVARVCDVHMDARVIQRCKVMGD